ncbi:piggyBac transposable element-derived protein 4-like [Odontomachus brunneus]|uniref:piggyBac transposable element-derived protein 4-like n=1 Tax=Odontomachus brunneus TaxID=486640 RepID=UPI0013F20685|nr:piggyBac transposable element-derived protein 4-like [Odontomachus brunneus]
MANHLRPWPIRLQLLKEDREDNVDENFPDENSGNNIEEHSEENSNYSESAEDTEMDVDLEEATLEQHLLKSDARGRPSTTLKGKNGFVWDTRAPECRSDRHSDVHPELTPGPADAALNVETIEQFWDLLFNEEIIETIVEQTNNKIEDVCAHLIAENKVETYHHHTDVKEIRAYIGVLYFAGLWKSSNIDDNRLWDKKNGITLYRCVFPRHRFSFLSSCLRFDDKNSREEGDKFAPVRKIWNIFIGNCQRYYTPSKKCTVDEQLLSFRGRCIFRMYIKSKPNKYGLKVVTLNDAETSYLIHAIPYLGKSIVRVGDRNESIPEYFFRKVTAPIHGTNRTVTCNNWFTTIPLLQRMLLDPFNMTITGTIRKNKWEIPAELKVASKEIPSTKFCHALHLTLLSHTPKKNKIVLLVSSYMHSREITNNKPNIILHYNETKGGTNSFDQLCHSYTVTRRTNRWPMRIFFGMLDQAIVNARILWKCKLKAANSNEKYSAIVCLERIYLHLVTPFLTERYATSTLRKDLKLAIAGILKKDVHSDQPYKRLQLTLRQRCAFCTRKEDKKTREACASCKRPICDNHRILFCNDCAGS